MILIFEGQGLYAKLEIDRDKKELFITSTKTNMIRTPTSWNMLFDGGKEKQQEEMTSKLNDADFKALFIDEMKKIGYDIKKQED